MQRTAFREGLREQISPILRIHPGQPRGILDLCDIQRIAPSTREEIVHPSSESLRTQTPVHRPQANAFYERLINTIRRECLDWLIVLNETHLRSVLQEWVAQYNHGRPHASLGPGIPDLPFDRPARPNPHQIPAGHRVMATPILAGLHHEYRFEPLAA